MPLGAVAPRTARIEGAGMNIKALPQPKAMIAAPNGRASIVPRCGAANNKVSYLLASVEATGRRWPILVVRSRSPKCVERHCQTKCTAGRFSCVLKLKIGYRGGRSLLLALCLLEKSMPAAQNGHRSSGKLAAVHLG
jgi:hypothetical protein